MVRTAAEKRKHVLDPVGDTETKSVDVEFCDRRGARHRKGDMTKFERANAAAGLRYRHLLLVLEKLDLRSLAIDERSRPRDGRADVAAYLVLDLEWPQLCRDAFVVEARRDLKRNASASVR